MRSGFTLAELLIVIAIIAVLVAVSIPVFGGALEKSRAAVCMANRRSWLAELSVGSMLEEITLGPGTVYAKDDDKSKMYTCPSGGEIYYQTTADGLIKVYCTKHKTVLDNSAALLQAALNSVLNDPNFSNYGANVHIDSHATGASLSGWAKSVKSKLPASADIASWVILNPAGGKQFVWSTIDIDDVNKGSTVPVICYNESDKTYSVGTSKVGTQNSYKIIDTGNSYAPGDSGETGLNFEDASAKYMELLEQYEKSK